MGITTIHYCDMCGKRTESLNNILSLFKEKKNPYSKSTVFSKRICDTCAKNLSGFQFQGDVIKDKIEMAIDNLKIHMKDKDKCDMLIDCKQSEIKK